jgi:hypothetical protein
MMMYDLWITTGETEWLVWRTTTTGKRVTLCEEEKFREVRIKKVYEFINQLKIG